MDEIGRHQFARHPVLGADRRELAGRKLIPGQVGVAGIGTKRPAAGAVV